MEIPSALQPNQIPAALSPSPAPVALNPEAQALQAPSEAPQTPAGPSYQMLQTETKHAIDVPHDYVYTAVKSGQYLPKKADEFVIKDSYGEARIVTGEYLKQALDQGFRLESSQELHERTLQEKYGDASGIVQALGAGAARGGTMGLSDLAASASPDARQHLSNLEEANPVASMVGEVAGFLGGSLVGSTEEAGAVRAAGLLVRGTEKLGASAGSIVEKAIVKDATKAGVSKKIAASIAGKMAQEATVGAVIGTGNFISEAALGKADVNAENLATAVSMGAIIGGAFGLGIGATKAAIPAVAAGAKLVADPFIGKAEHLLDDKVASARLLGLTPTQLAKLEERNPGVIKGMQDYLRDDLQLGYADTAESLLQKNEAVRAESGQKISSVLGEIDKALELNPELKPKASEVWSNVYKKVFTTFEDYFGDVVAPGAEKIQKPITEFLDGIDRLSRSTKEFTGSDLQKLKKMEDALLNYEKSPGKWSAFEDAVHVTRNALKEEIDRVAQNLESKGLSSDLSNQLKIANRQFSSAATFGDFIEKRALKAADKTISLTGAIKDVGLDISRKMAVLGKIEQAQQATSKLVGRAVKNILNPVSEKLRKSQAAKVLPLSILNSEFAKKFDGQKYKKPVTVSEAFVNMNDNFARYTNNPEAFMNRVNRSTASIYHQAPQTSQALDALAVSAATFLASKLPKRQSAPGMLDMFSKPRPPSKYDLAKFEHYMTVVEHPEHIFKEIEVGKLSHESVEALQAVYPNLYEQIKSRTLEAVAAHPKLSYNSKLQLGILLNMPTHESTLPQNVLALQSNFQSDGTSNEQGAVKPSQGGLSKLNVAERMETDTQGETELNS